MTQTFDPAGIDLEALRASVRAEYAAVASDPDRGFHFHTGYRLAAILGYPQEWIAALPPAAVVSMAGTGNPFVLGPIDPGERVVDCGSGAGADAMMARSRSSPSWMSPEAPIVPWNRPRPGTCMNRSPSTPWLGSSVTSKRIMGHCRRAAASSAPVPGRPVQLHSDRRRPASTGCAVQCKLTGAVRTRAIAHSTCWHTASGVEWTYTTPHVGTVTSRRPRCVFPYDLDRG